MVHKKVNSPIGIFLTLLLVSIAPSKLPSQSLCGYIIETGTHQPISQARVHIRELQQQTSSDDRGFFSFHHIAAGHYTLSVHHLAYATLNRRILTPASAGDTIILEMQSVVLSSDEVIIRSTRTGLPLRNSPYPLNVKIGEQLFQNPKVTISDILSHDPGVTLVRDGIWETSVAIRGMSGSKIVSLIDNTRIETATDIAGALSLMNMNDLERVETLKSPGSVLYGTGALGGVVHFVTKRASFSDQTQLHAELSSGLTGVDNGVSHSLAIEQSSEFSAVRLSGGYRSAGNTLTPIGALPNSQYTDFHINGSLGIKTFNHQSLFLSYQRSQAENTGIPGVSSFANSALVRYVLAKRELILGEYTIPNLSSLIPLVRIRASRQQIVRNVESLQGDTLRLTPHAIHTTNTVQVESNISPSSDHQLVVGAEAWQRDLDSQREKNLPKVKRVIGERPIPQSSYFSGGVYIQDEWTTVPEKLTLTFGARYDWIRIKNEKVYNPVYTISSGIMKINAADSTILWPAGSVRNQSWSASVGAQYVLNSLFDVTLLTATAFRSPSLEERFQYLDLGVGTIQLGNPNLQPERSMNFDAGIRFHTSACKIKTDFFFNDLQDLIAGIPGRYKGRPAIIKANISKAKIYGYEFSAEYVVTSWSVLSGSLAYVRGEDTYLHTNLPQIAPLSGQLEFNAFVSQAGFINLSCHGMASQENLATGETRTAGWAIVDIGFATVPMRAGLCSITLKTGLQNILNTAYQNYLSTLRGINKDEPGRNYYLTGTITF